MSRAYPTAQQARALALHRRGATTTQIADALSVSRQRARAVIVGLGLRPHRVRRPAGEGPRHRPLADVLAARRAVRDARRAQVADLVRTDPSLTSAQIAARLCIAPDTVRHDRRALGCAAVPFRRRSSV